jgi:murein DD-endopeptidase MepM/ murein hydrolase activator NlpD
MIVMKGRQSWTRIITLCLSLSLALALTPSTQAVALSAPAAPQPDPQAQLEQRLDLFKKASTLTGIPWPYLAAIDQYERTMNIAKKRKPLAGLISIYISESDWAGALNPNQDDTNPKSIALFNGIGSDGSGDGKADRHNDLDLLAAMTSIMCKQGINKEDLRIGLWNYYHNTRSVQRIDQFAKIYASQNTLDLYQHAFPLPITADYTYRSTWGASRGWGGFRIHEGTDLFVGYGVPVRSTCYGIVEIKGWNPYGGWRIGIRDLNNVYHYYAHLSGFQKELQEGDLVTPGQTVGWVGSSGYGKPGTSGKFPPHLHYGLYRDNGLSEWSFDPYPYLRRWEREDYQKRKKK